MRRSTNRILLPALLLAVISAACNGGGSSSGGGGGGGATVTVSPGGVNMVLGSTQPFSASVSGAKTFQIVAGNGAVRAASVVTITTTATHGFSAGQTVSVSGVTDATFSGLFTILAVPSPTTFTYTQTGADATSGGGAVSNISVNWFVNDIQGGNSTVGTITTGGLYTAPDALPPPQTATITSTGAVRSNNVVTITTAAAHNFVVGQSIIISGVTDASFNGAFTVSAVPSSTTFTYDQTANNASSGSGAVTSFAVKIKAVSVSDSSVSGSAVAVISSGITVNVKPTNVQIGTGETQPFAATVVGSSNQSVTWSVNGIAGGNSSVGAITTTSPNTALFTAPSAPPASASVAIASSGAVRAFNGAVRFSNGVTVTTVTAHNFSVNQSVIISGASDSSFNGTFTIASVPTATTFTYAQVGANASSSGGTAAVGSNSVGIATTSAVTITTTTAHGFATGQPVTMAGVSDTSFNGAFTIATIVSATAFTYAQTGPNATSGGGTATSTSPSVTITATSVADTTRSGSVLIFVVVAADPTLTSINPTRAPQGTVFQDVFLTGTNFLSTSAVRVNGSATGVAVTLFSNTLLRARIPATLLATIGTLTLDVQRQNLATSASLNLTVFATRPALIGAGPDNGVQGGGAVSFNVDGGYYGPSSNPSITAKFGGNAKSAPVDPTLDARRATISIGGSDLNVAGLFSVQVHNNVNSALYSATNFAVRPNVAPTVLGACVPPMQACSVVVGTAPSSIAINSATGIAVVTNRCSSNITRINVDTLAVVGSPIAVGDYPTGVAVDEVNNRAIVVNNGSNTGCAGPAGTPSLSVVDLAGGSVSATIPASSLSGTPFSVGINPLTGLAIVAYQSTNRADIIDLTLVPPAVVSTTTISTGANPQVAVEPQLNWALVTPGGAGTLSIVDLAQRVSVAIAANGLSRTAGVTTVTTSAAHPFRANQVVRISGATDPTFNGTFTISGVPSSTTFTFAQTGLPNGSTTGGAVVTTNPVALANIGPNVRGVGINPITQQAMLADPSAGGPMLFNLFDQAVTTVSLNEMGANAAAFSRFTNIGVITNSSTNEASLIDPQITNNRVGKVTVGNGPRAVAIDSGSNTALVVNETDGTVTAIGLGAIRPLHISSLVLPLARQLVPGVTLTSGSDLDITIIGKGFTSSSLARLDGVPLAAPAGATDRQMTVTVPFALLSAPHNYVVDVVDSGPVVSNVLSLTVVQSVDLVGAGGASCAAPAPAAVAIDAERDVAIIANSGCDSASIVDLNTGTISSTVSVQSRPRGVAISSRLGKAVVTNSGAGTASILDITTGPPTVTATVSTGSEPLGVAINESRSSAIVASASGNTISLFDLTQAAPSPASITMNSRPVAVAVDPERELALVANAASNDLALVSLSGLNVVGRVSGVSQPTGVVFDPTMGVFVATSSLANQIVVVNPVTFQATRARTGINPTSLAMNPNSSTLVTVNSGSGSISVMDYLDRSIRVVLGIAASSHFAVDIHPRTNLAVIVDEAGNRALLLPLPR